MHQLTPLIYDLAIMLGLAGIVVLIFQRIHQPVVLGYLVAGMILGPHTPPYALVSDLPNIKILSELGVIFLMFSLGLEFSFRKLMHVGVSAIVIGLIEVVIMIFIGYGLGSALGWSHYNCLFLGAALSISSTTIIIKAIEELKLNKQHFSQLVYGILIVEDLLAIILLVVLSTAVLTNAVTIMDVAYAAMKLIAVVGSWFLLGYFLVPPLFRNISRYVNEEILTIISVALCLFLVQVAAHFHYSTALGAFIMGSIIAETELVHKINKLIRPIRDIFAAVFFISVGMLIDPHIVAKEWGTVVLIALITVIGKILTTCTAAFITGQSLNTTIRTGFSMAQIGEFSFIIVALGLALSAIDAQLYPLVVAVSVLTTFTTPYLIKLSGYLSQRVENKLPVKVKSFLEKYREASYRAQVALRTNPNTRSVLLRLFINGLIVAIIFTAADQVFFPKVSFLNKNTWDSNIESLVIASIISSPFIWGMLFSYKKLRLHNQQRLYLNPAVILIWVATFTEIALLSILYFESWLTVLVFVVLAAVFFIFLYRQLEISYKWFERHLIKNVNFKHKKKKD